MIHSSFGPSFFGAIGAVKTENLVFVLGSSDNLPEELSTPVLAEKIDAKRKSGKCFSLRLDAFGPDIGTLHVLGLSTSDDVSAKIAEYVRSIKEGIVLAVSEGMDVVWAVESFGLGAYVFDRYLSDKKPRTLGIVWNTSHSIEEAIGRVNAIYAARDLVNMPPNEKFPRKMVDLIRAMDWKRTKITVLGKNELEKEWFGMLLAVSAGSDNEPQVVVFERLAANVPPKYAFVWKGVTFDSGGIQIKPDDAMLDMKIDMAGAAAVIATMRYLDDMENIPHGVIGAIGLVENMTGWSASKPLDIVRAHNGLTVEIHHTDAEGRLVLGDVVSYVSKQYKPENAITIATLTGACMHALGYDYAGLIGTSETLVAKLFEDSKKLPEKLWMLPLNESMLEATKASIADRKNLTKSMKAGASMGAAFIAQFVPKEVAYAHLDIAGPSYRDKENGIFPSEATGFGFYTLSNLSK